MKENKGDGVLARTIRQTFDQIMCADEAYEFTIKMGCYEVTSDGKINDLMASMYHKFNIYII